MLANTESIKGLREALVEGSPVGLSINELIAILDTAILVEEAGRIVANLVKHSINVEAVRDGAAFLDKLNELDSPEAPCAADAPASDPQSASHKEASTPASRATETFAGTDSAATPPGKNKDRSRLPAQPSGEPLSREERECAEKLADAAERMIRTFREHLDICAPCSINWQTLRKRLGQWQSVTRK